MRSLFHMGFRDDFQNARLGQMFDWGSLISSVVGSGLQIWQSIEAQESATRARKAAEAARAKAEAQLKLQQEEQKKAQAAAGAAVTAEKEEKILGLPRDAVILGGIGLVAVIGIIAVLK